METVIVPHGGYRKLKSFQISQLVYDLTARFCDRYVDRRSRTHDQMLQAARSGVQNIAEGSQASATSKKTELKLTNVARASLEELRLDYEDFLRQRRLPIWLRDDERRKQLVALRPVAVDQIVQWAVQSVRSSEASSAAEAGANAALTLISVATYLLDRQIGALARAFEREGGFSERLYRVRANQRR